MPEHPRSFWPSMAILVVFLISQGNLTRIIGPLDPSFMEMQFTFSPERYAEILKAWGTAGTDRYRSHFFFDAVHPLIFGLLGFVTVQTSPLFGRLSVAQERIYAWLLPFAATLDYIENLCQWKLLTLQQGTASWLVPLSATCASIKWGLAVLFVGLWLWQTCKWIKGRVTESVPK